MEIFKQYRPMLRGIVSGYLRLGRRYGLEWDDLYNAALFGLYKADKSFDGAKCSHFKGWARIKVRSEVQDEIRRWTHRDNLKNTPEDILAERERLRAECLNLYYQRETSDPLEECEKNQIRAFLRKWLESLSARERIVFKLYFFDNLDLKEVGGVLGISESRVSQITIHCLNDLKKRAIRFRGNPNPMHA